MKTCSCGAKIRDEQVECINCFKERNNFRWIEPDEIVFDIDSKELGYHGINFSAINLLNAGYKFSIFSHQGRSPHLHIFDIPHLEDLTPEQLRKYKEAIIRKYCPAEYLQFADLSLCSKHLVAEENKPHYRTKKIKRLCSIWNENKQNFCEVDIYNQLKEIQEYKPSVIGTGITAKITAKISIIDIARQFGLDVQGNKCLCPFHKDSNPSLVFYVEQGRFCCFGCQAKGNIIKFYAMLKELNPEFVYRKNEQD